jgi:hypothetical protein
VRSILIADSFKSIDKRQKKIAAKIKRCKIRWFGSKYRRKQLKFQKRIRKNDYLKHIEQK